MPFDPLPAPLAGDLERLRRGGPAVAIDLGCGDSDLAARLSGGSLAMWGLDRTGVEMGGTASVIADVRLLPVRPGSVDLLLAANLVRHLLPMNPDAGFLEHWLAVLRPGGVLYILEDMPDLSTPARRNYHGLQSFLARVCGPRRGPLLAEEAFQELVQENLPEVEILGGRAINVLRPDHRAVRDMLRGRGQTPTGEAKRLLRAITRHGLDYGDYWWARLRPRED